MLKISKQEKIRAKIIWEWMIIDWSKGIRQKRGREMSIEHFLVGRRNFQQKRPAIKMRKLPHMRISISLYKVRKMEW